MIETFILVMTILAFYIYYTFVYKPAKLMKHYQQTLQDLGYKVRVLPFKAFGSSLYDYFRKEEKEHGDQYYSIKREDGKYDIGIFNILNEVILDLYSPELMQEFLGPQNPYLYYKIDFLIGNLRRCFGKGIGFSEGKQWKPRRVIMNKVFNYDFLKASIPKITKICNDNYNKFESDYFQQNKEQKKTIKFDILEIFSSIYSNVMFECFFGIQTTFERVDGDLLSVFLNKLNNDTSLQGIQPLTLLCGAKILDLGLTEKHRDINRRIKILKSIGKQKIQKRLNQLKNEGFSENSSDIVQTLYKNGKIQFDGHKKDDDGYDFKELVEVFCGFATAGTDTTSHLVQMMIYYIALNPQVQKKLREQIDEHIKSDSDITYQNLKKLTYIDWIQNQTTRMYGPATTILTRYATQNHLLKDIPIQKGTGITYTPVVNHYSSKYFEDPLAFKPQRWEKGMKDIHPYALNGFSGGPRSCIGKHLSLLESKIGVLKFIQRYKQLDLSKKDFNMIQKFIYEPEPLTLTATVIDRDN